MTRLFLIFFAIGMTAMSSTSMAAMSTSKVRKETRFLTDKMAYELNLNTNQYDDAYEINYDFVNSIRYIMDDVVRGYEWALDDYYQALDIRNDDLRYVLSDSQYRRFIRTEYCYRPIYTSGNNWNFRVYITYSNHNHYYFGRPHHYRSYSGGHYRKHYNNASYYSGRYNHTYYSRPHSVRDNRVYHTNRRSDFGSITIRPNTSARPGNSSSSRPGTSNRPENNSSSRPGTSNRPENNSSSRPGTSNRPESGSSTKKENSSNKREPSSSSRRSSNNERKSQEKNPSSSRRSSEVKKESNSSSSRSSRNSSDSPSRRER